MDGEGAGQSPGAAENVVLQPEICLLATLSAPGMGALAEL